MNRLTEIGVGFYKSIKDLQPFVLGQLNVLIGANGAGKSNLISFLRLLSSIPARKFQESVGLAGGAHSLLYYGGKTNPGLWTSLRFESKTGPIQYFTWLRLTADDTLIFAEEEIDERATTGSSPNRTRLGSGQKESATVDDENRHGSFLELLRGIQVFHFEDTSDTAAIRRRGYIEDNQSLRPDAGNLAAYLLQLRQHHRPYYDRILTAIRQVAPFFDDFDLRPMKSDPNSVLLNWRDRDSEHLFGPHQLSDGTLRLMALVTLLAQPEDDLPGLIVLDEPEIGLHPYAMEVVAGLIRSASVQCQILVATQAASLVNHFEPDEIITVTRSKAQSHFSRLDARELDVWLKDYAMGELWEKNVIGGGVPVR
jgi:predicted ATPase